jgi:phage shock protein PspC (stress-responsive transcriptional regulator)
MEKVTIVNLGGRAYQIEEGGMAALKAYLDAAARNLAANPDRTEIIADLERAVADKCDRLLGPGKNVVTAQEIAAIIGEMGPVDGGEAAAEAAAKTGEEPPSARKRLYRIREGRMIAGVCNGFAAYFDLDVAIMRILFVVAALITHGVWALVYVVMMFVIPTADTAEEFAAAHGMKFNAQELVDQAKAHYAEFRARNRWRRSTRATRRAWRDQPRPAHAPVGYGGQILAGLVAPIFALMSALCAIAMVLALISLWNSATIFGWPLPQDIPVWAAMLLVILVYNTLIWPLRAVRRASYYALGGGRGWFEAWDSVLVISFVIFLGWLAYLYIPSAHEFVDSISRFWREPNAADRLFQPR